MGYRNLQSCVSDLRRHGHLIDLEVEVDPYLEAAYLQRRLYAAKGPAVLLKRLKNCAFPALANLYGTPERTRFLFRDALEAVRHLVDLKIDPKRPLRKPFAYLDTLPAVLHALPRTVRRGPILEHQTTLSRLPHIQSWPRDGGPFITLPAVYSEDPDRPGWRHSNLGMYRVQISGNDYRSDHEVGMHYQIHRGIGVHHAAAIRRGSPLQVNIFVGGPPALPFAAVMPLPEGLPEIAFAGALAGHRIPWLKSANGLLMPAECDFVISGSIDPCATKPEGPFGDHLGYYSLIHPFPFVTVDRVYHRANAIWPFTSVGRPPQEDTSFGELIHDLVGPVVPTVLPGVRAVHAVDAAGVHPLLLAIGSERYVPYAERRKPQELLTQACAILGQGQMSLAKFLLIVAQEDDPTLNIHDIAAFLQHLLARVNWSEDLHFLTRTTIDTLDYSGHGFNQGSKLIIAAAGPPRRQLLDHIPPGLSLPAGFTDANLALPGILVVKAPPFSSYDETGVEQSISKFLSSTISHEHLIRLFPLVILADDALFASQNLNNLLWVVFTRANPAADVHGIDSFTHQKHWGCHGPLLIDARIKPHHAPPLEDDPAVIRRVEALAARGQPLHGLI